MRINQRALNDGVKIICDKELKFFNSALSDCAKITRKIKTQVEVNSIYGAEEVMKTGCFFLRFIYRAVFIFLLIVASLGNATAPQCPEQVFSPFTTIQKGQINFLPHYGCVGNLQLSGHLPVNKKQCNDIYCSEHQASLFYWFVASQQDRDEAPIILWLNGGPGASSFYGFFSENGPYFVTPQGKLRERTYSWNKIAHYLMIDNPKGVGFSYGKHNNLIKDEKLGAIELYNALLAFYERYPELRHNQLYLSGESYAGKYVAELAEQISNHNREANASAQINLRGIMVGDGWVNPLIQQSSVADYAYYHGLIDENTYNKVKKLYQLCAHAIRKGALDANNICMKINDTVAQASGVDRHDIRTLAEIDYRPIIDYLNKSEVRKAIHVDPRIVRFKLFNDEVSKNLDLDIQKSAASTYEQLLNKKIPVLIYNGLDDGTDSNFIGTDLWLKQLNWPGKKDWDKAITCKWYNMLTQDVAGYVRQAHELTQIKIRGAGHMAPMDQPENTLDMIKKFMQKQKWC